MPRLARLVLPGVALHIVQRGHNGRPCFEEDTDRLVYLALLRDALKKSGCVLHAYCLMTNHVHLLATPADESGFAVLMRHLGQRYVQYFNARHARKGTLWEGRPHSCLVESAEYVLACYRYIERNPVRARMVPAPGEYKWSSHEANAAGARNGVIVPHVEYVALAEDPERRRCAYLQLIGGVDDPAFLAEVREATNGGYPLVSKNMKARLATVSDRPLERRKPGPQREKARGPEDVSASLPF